MFPAIFYVDFQGQGQRSKVTAIKYIGHITIAKFMADLPCESAANGKISKVNTFSKYRVQFSNDLDPSISKVKVIYPKFAQKECKIRKITTCVL